MSLVCGVNHLPEGFNLIRLAIDEQTHSDEGSQCVRACNARTRGCADGKKRFAVIASRLVGRRAEQ